MKNNSTKSQITIFIIIALIIVVSIALIFVLVKKPTTIISAEQNPQAYIENCLKNSLEKAETEILEGNGYLNVTDNYILISINKPREKVPYFCKSSEFYRPCINQEPMLNGLVKNEFQSIAKKDAEICFSNLEKELKNKGYAISLGTTNLNVNLYPGQVSAEVNKKITISKGDESRNYEFFVGEIISPVYSLINHARMIVNYESTLCEFNLMNWMKYNRDIKISRFVTSDQTKVYTVTDLSSGKKISFALRTCVLPAGI